MKPLRRTVKVIVLAFGMLSCIAGLSASPRDDLSSPSQEVRDAAAKILRETYKPPPATNWDALVRALELGTKRSVIEAQLRSSNLVVGGGVGIGKIAYGLDDRWVLECSFTNFLSGVANSALAHVALREQLHHVWVEPATNFTGVWRTYWVNGQPSDEFHYQDGRQEGVMTTFYPDGSKVGSVLLHNGVSEGEETTYYPSGKIYYKGTYRAGKQVGTWVWYNEDGSVQSKKDYTKK